MALPLADRFARGFPIHLRVSREINANTNSSVLITYLEANSVASTVWKVHGRGLWVCSLYRAISKIPFELGIGPICSWQLQNLKTSDNTFGHDIMPLTTPLVKMTEHFCITNRNRCIEAYIKSSPLPPLLSPPRPPPVRHIYQTTKFVDTCYIIPEFLCRLEAMNKMHALKDRSCKDEAVFESEMKVHELLLAGLRFYKRQFSNWFLFLMYNNGPDFNLLALIISLNR